MSDPRIANLARTLVNYSIRAQSRETISIGGNSVAEPLIQTIYEELLRKGVYPIIQMTPERATDAFFELGQPFAHVPSDLGQLFSEEHQGDEQHDQQFGATGEAEKGNAGTHRYGLLLLQKVCWVRGGWVRWAVRTFRSIRGRFLRLAVVCFRYRCWPDRRWTCR